MNLNVRIGGSLGDFVSHSVGENGSYDNVSEYIRDLIRKDKTQQEEAQFLRLKAELQQAFHASEAEYETLGAADIIARNTHTK